MKKTAYVILATLTVIAPLVGEEIFLEEGHKQTENRFMGPAERALEKEAMAKEERENVREGGECIQASTRKAYIDCNTFYYNAHLNPMDVTPLGDVVTLVDGSLWSVSSWDWCHTRNWLATDMILVTQNTAFFSIYDYELINLSSGATVRANLLNQTTPTYKTRFITGFHDGLDYIYLDDGSVWEISGSDHYRMMKWCLNDHIVVGTNSGWNQSSRPNILINSTINQYLKARCIQ